MVHIAAPAHSKRRLKSASVTLSSLPASRGQAVFSCNAASPAIAQGDAGLAERLLAKTSLAIR